MYPKTPNMGLRFSDGQYIKGLIGILGIEINKKIKIKSRRPRHFFLDFRMINSCFFSLALGHDTFNRADYMLYLHRGGGRYSQCRVYGDVWSL